MIDIRSITKNRAVITEGAEPHPQMIIKIKIKIKVKIIKKNLQIKMNLNKLLKIFINNPYKIQQYVNIKGTRYSYFIPLILNYLGKDISPETEPIITYSFYMLMSALIVLSCFFNFLILFFIPFLIYFLNSKSHLYLIVLYLIIVQRLFSSI